MKSDSLIEPSPNPALEEFLARIGQEQTVGQVLVRPQMDQWELRHVQDRAEPADALRLVPCEELRSIAQFTRSGAFRPLKSAPSLQTGWRASARIKALLALALDELYPGFLADWHARDAGPITDFRSYADRQSGMYRIVALLSDSQTGRVIRAVCDERFCLKRRLWSVAGVAPDRPVGKSIIPCLEPCAVFTEFARKAMRLEQSAARSLALAPEEWETVAAALRHALEHPDPTLREADFGAPMNPRRVLWTLDKVRAEEHAHMT